MSTIATAVSHLKQPEAIEPTVQRLGQKHRGLGVKDAHYAIVGEALMWALEQQLGAAFTPDLKVAWASMYGDIATVMKRAA
jgi:hemoglobin-like flavoprotein